MPGDGEMRTGFAFAAGLAVALLMTGCGGVGAGNHAHLAGAAACPAAAPRLVVPGAADTGHAPAELVRPGPQVASVCQYALGMPPAKVGGMAPRIVLNGPAAAGLAAVVDSAGRLTSADRRCDQFPFSQQLVFGYAAHPAATVTIAFTTCDLAVVTAGVSAGALSFQIESDLFSYTAISASARGPRTPGLIGLSGTAAQAAAQRRGYSLNFGGAVLDQQVPFGTVVFQSPSPDAITSLPGSQVDLILGVGHAPDCATRQLALSFIGGGAGAGNDFGTLVVRDTAARPCTLSGPLLVTGLGVSGRADTTTTRLPVSGVTVLSPDAGPITSHVSGASTISGAWPGELAGLVSLVAEYRDSAATSNGLCAPLWVIPTTWRVTFPDGGALLVSNADPGDPVKLTPSGGFVTCRGQLGALQPAYVGSP